MSPLDRLKPECPHCTSQDNELQRANAIQEVYLCNTCSKTFSVHKATGRVQPK